jgi:hypothetical protein
MSDQTTPKSSWFSYAPGYDERPLAWTKGRRVGGYAIGIVQLEAHIPMPPGDMGNATTFDFPVLYDTLGDIDPFLILAEEPHPDATKAIIEVIRRLEVQGVRAVLGNCGFFANYQPMVAEAVDVPFYSSSLMLLPLILPSLGSKQKVGILTADGPKLKKAPALANCGVSEKDMERVVIYGAESCPQMKNVVGEVGIWDINEFEGELIGVAKDMLAEHPDIDSIVLECTEFPPVAHAMQEELQLPIWGYPDLVNWIQGGVVRRSFGGWI